MLGILLLIGFILIIPLFFAIPIRANNAPAVKTTPTSYVTFTPAPGSTSEPGGISVLTPPAPTSVALGEKPSVCTFPLAHTRPAKSVTEDYTFSEPKEPLPPDDSLTEIVEWLPDNQRILLVESFDDVTTGEYKQNLELLNPQTGETQIYASRQPGSGLHYLPAWVPGLNVVVYPETRLLNTTQKDGMNLPPYEFERQLWVSRGDPANAQLIENEHLTANGMFDFSVVVQPGGSQFAYRTAVDKRLFKRDGSLAAQPPVTFDPTRWDYRRPDDPVPWHFTMAWRPGTSQIFFHNNWDTSPGYTFLVDVDTGQVCELNLDGWALLGRWSPDGRYLAIVRAQGHNLIYDPTDLAILDVATGRLYTMKVAPDDVPGRYDVAGITWAPDNYHLLVLGSVLAYQGCSPNCYEDTRLYLVDFLAGQVKLVLPANQFTANDPGTNLAWSPDGSKILALCPNICFISVQRSSK